MPSPRHVHEQEHQVDGDAALEAHTRDVLAHGVQSDLLQSAMNQACAISPAPQMHVQVDRSKSAELASVLKSLVTDPSAVTVTDAHGKAVALRAGITHQDLADLVCASGCRLNIKPNCGHAQAAAAIANGTDGRVLLPGQSPISGRSVAEEVVEALRNGNEARIASMAVELERLGLVNASEPSRAFYSAVTGTQLDGVSTEWQECLNVMMTSWRERGCISIVAEDLDEPAPVAPAAPVQTAVADDADHLQESEGRMVVITADEVAVVEPALAGSCTGMEMLEMAQFVHASGRTGLLNIASPNGVAYVWFSNGSIVHAQHGDTTGAEATEAMIASGDDRARFTFDQEAEAPSTTITASTPMLLLDLSRRLDERDL